MLTAPGAAGGNMPATSGPKNVYKETARFRQPKKNDKKKKLLYSKK